MPDLKTVSIDPRCKRCVYGFILVPKDGGAGRIEQPLSTPLKAGQSVTVDGKPYTVKLNLKVSSRE